MEYSSDIPYPSLNDVLNWPEISRILKTHEWLQLTSACDLAASVYVFNGFVRKWSLFLQENGAILDKLTNSNKYGASEKESCEVRPQTKSTRPSHEPAVKTGNVDKSTLKNNDVYCRGRSDNLDRKHASEENHISVESKSKPNSDSTPSTQVSKVPVAICEKSQTNNTEIVEKVQSARVSIIYSPNLNSLINQYDYVQTPNPNILQKRKSHCLKPLPSSDPLNGIDTQISIDPGENESHKKYSKNGLHSKDSILQSCPELPSVTTLVCNDIPIKEGFNNNVSNCKSINNCSEPFQLILTVLPYKENVNCVKIPPKCKKPEKINRSTQSELITSKCNQTDIEMIKKVDTAEQLTRQNCEIDDSNGSKHKTNSKSHVKKKRFKYYRKKFGLKKCFIVLERMEIIEKNVELFNSGGHLNVKACENNKFIISLPHHNLDAGKQTAKTDNPDNMYNVKCASNTHIEIMQKVNTNNTLLKVDDCLARETNNNEQASSNSINKRDFSNHDGDGCISKNVPLVGFYNRTSITARDCLNRKKSKNKCIRKDIKFQKNNDPNCILPEKIDQELSTPLNIVEKKHESVLNNALGESVNIDSNKCDIKIEKKSKHKKRALSPHGNKVNKSQTDKIHPVPSLSCKISSKPFTSFNSKNNELKKCDTLKSKHGGIKKHDVNSFKKQKDKVKNRIKTLKANDIKNHGVNNVNSEEDNAIRHTEQIKCGYFSFSLLKDLKKCDIPSSTDSNVDKHKKDKITEEKFINTKDLGTTVIPSHSEQCSSEITSDKPSNKVNINSTEPNQMKSEMNIVHTKDSGAFLPLLVDNEINRNVQKLNITFSKVSTNSNIINDETNNFKISIAKENLVVLNSSQKFDNLRDWMQESPEKENCRDPRLRGRDSNKRIMPNNSDIEPPFKRLCERAESPQINFDLKLVSFDKFTCSFCSQEFREVKEWILHAEEQTCTPKCVEGNDQKISQNIL